ncbi:MAG: class I SAM-dependent RNA methyltransferase [Verrucomicrobia bacterium]|nr:class I SAM-dependent RNA methyltransferase [Verrucomicrobiota bacterium]
MNLSPGTIVSLSITDIAFGGEGVARRNDFVVFVPFVLLGEFVEAEITEIKKKFARARLLRVVQPSPERVTPPCRYFGDCCGCQYQHIAYEAQLRIKHKQIADLFERVGKFAPDLVAPVIPCPQPYGYRNRIMIRSQWNKPQQKLNIGFIRADNRLVVDIEECKIAEPALNQEIQRVRAHPPPKGGIKVVLRVAPEGWEVPRDSFFQNNFFLLPKLVEVVRERLRSVGVQASACQEMSPRREQAEAWTPTGRFLVDVYCGVGFFSVELADLVESFVGVELDNLAITAARQNATAHSRTNGEFIAGRAEDLLPSLLTRFPPASTTVLLDPPRKGCSPESLQVLRQTRPSQIIYVSCHPATLARDLNVLCADGVFELARVIPLDMFPQTQHVECVADLRRKDSPSGE